MRSIPELTDERELVGLGTSDDASVIKLNEEQALIQSLDFFTPVVDDPYLFGKIAATNSLSDIYAMGGEVLSAMNIVGFPSCLEIEVLEQILQGGAAKVKEAGAILAGGHTIEDDEPKYGLSVSGLIAPDQLITNAGAKPGDRLVLTKPIGIGVTITAMKGGMIAEEEDNPAIEAMITLNKEAAEVMKQVGVNACTDVTGFGFLGHLWEMVSASKVGAEIEFGQIPLLPKVIEWAEMGLVPGGAYRNQEYISEDIDFAANINEAKRDILFDPQTSGGLLISVVENKIEELINKLDERGVKAVAVGRITDNTSKIKIKE
ncbi:selenophosphate synthase [Candidatus Frackibacter sp. WG12]|nr:selenophosphate synthase [Candidatus Frackibacter sp. WG11]SEN02217.1 selenophosphate synthase [Candidatus Frackibacter sp. WG12]SFM10956.1 selenophosphate synthase [Candidatus Frackibacter sp. WG13]